MLIPSLPDEVALLCLARIPYSLHPLARCVSRAWRDGLGRPEPRLIVCVVPHDVESGRRDRHDFLQSMDSAEMWWYVLDPVLRRWQGIPSPPCPRACTSRFGVPEWWHVLAWGGKAVALYGPEAFCLEIAARDEYSWRPAICMKEKSRFDYADDGFVYEAGGCSDDGRITDPSWMTDPSSFLKSAERFNLKRRRWERREADMERRLFGFKVRILGRGRVCVAGGRPIRWSPMTTVAWDPHLCTWRTVALAYRYPWPSVVYPGTGLRLRHVMHFFKMDNGIRSQRVALDGQLYVLARTTSTTANAASGFPKHCHLAQCSHYDPPYGCAVCRYNGVVLERVVKDRVLMPGCVFTRGARAVPLGMVPTDASLLTEFLAMGHELFVFAGTTLLITSPRDLPLRWASLPIPFQSEAIVSRAIVST